MRGRPRAAPSARSSNACTSRTRTRCTRATANCPTAWTSRRFCAGGAATAATKTNSCSATGATRATTATASGWTPCPWTSGDARSARTRTATTARKPNRHQHRKTKRRRATRRWRGDCKGRRTPPPLEPNATISSPPPGNVPRGFVTPVTPGAAGPRAVPRRCARSGPIAEHTRTMMMMKRRMRMKKKMTH